MAQQTQDILVESGTNELEILVFAMGKQRYGVNVAKVREVIEPLTTTRLPESHQAVLGVFQLRDMVTPLIDLRRALHLPAQEEADQRKIFILEFNGARVGFLVDTVEQIYRVSWENVAAVPEMEAVRRAPVTSIAHINDDMVLMLDFEHLVFEVSGLDATETPKDLPANSAARGKYHILLAEDSQLMRTVITRNLAEAGYTKLTVCADGQETWDQLERSVANGGPSDFDLMITDIEMPRIDGLHLTKRIKEHPQMQGIPVVIFSSLVSIDNEKKCQTVGADAQITKPQLGDLVRLLDRLIMPSGATDQNAPLAATAV